MLDNYEFTERGAIKQSTYQPYQYNADYLSTIYPGGAHKFRYTNFLRLGYVIGSYGSIPDSILEVGYGKGYFLEAAAEIIPDVFGYDINNSPLPEKAQRAVIMDGKHFDVICFWDALEHFDNLDFLSDLDCNMVVVSLPWCHYDWLEAMDGEQKADDWFTTWKHRKPDEHLYHFSANALVETLENYGYELVGLPTNIEDATRKGDGVFENILTAAFRKLPKN